MIRSIAHIGLTVSDLDRSVAFYRDTLRLSYVGEMKMEGPETEALFCRQGCQARVAYLQASAGPLVELIQFTHDPSAQSYPSLFKTSISELCFSVEDMDGEYRRLKALGVRFLSRPQTFDSTPYGFGRSRAVYFLDPDENILELIEDIK